MGFRMKKVSLGLLLVGIVATFFASLIAYRNDDDGNGGSESNSSDEGSEGNNVNEGDDSNEGNGSNSSGKKAYVFPGPNPKLKRPHRTLPISSGANVTQAFLCKGRPTPPYVAMRQY